MKDEKEGKASHVLHKESVTRQTLRQKRYVDEASAWLHTLAANHTFGPLPPLFTKDFGFDTLDTIVEYIP